MLCQFKLFHSLETALIERTSDKLRWCTTLFWRRRESRHWRRMKQFKTHQYQNYIMQWLLKDLSAVKTAQLNKSSEHVLIKTETECLEGRKHIFIWIIVSRNFFARVFFAKLKWKQKKNRLHGSKLKYTRGIFELKSQRRPGRLVLKAKDELT